METITGIFRDENVGSFENTVFSYCDFTGAWLSGEYINCIFESTCMFEGTQWCGRFIDCRGVGQ